MKATFLRTLPTETIHSHSQVVALTISVKQHLDQMENLPFLTSLVLVYIHSSNIKRTIKGQPDEFYFFPLQNLVCPLILCGKHSVYLGASLFSVSQTSVAHLPPCMLKMSLSAVHEQCLTCIPPGKVCTSELCSRNNRLHIVTDTRQ